MGRTFHAATSGGSDSRPHGRRPRARGRTQFADATPHRDAAAPRHGRRTPARYRGLMAGNNDTLGFLGEEDVKRFDDLLSAYIAITQVQCALLCDRTGRLLTSKGDTSGL